MRNLTSSLKEMMFVLAGLIILASCKNDDDESKATSGFANISYVVKTAEENKTLMSVSADTTVKPFVDWKLATVYVEKIVFKGKGESMVDTVITIEKKLNIFNKEALVGIVKLPSGSYKDVDVKMICRKSEKSDFAFDFRGTFYTTKGRDSLIVGSSFPFEVALSLNNLVIDPFKSYEATFSFDLHKVLTGITGNMIESDVIGYNTLDNNRQFVIWKGGSQEEPFYEQIIRNWEKVVTVTVREIPDYDDLKY